MDAFGRLSPALQYQIVNGLGWVALRPVQEEAIHAVLDGLNCMILAPTAGGKTEAALFPLLSRIDAEDLLPTSVLYVAPIRALLNNQEARLESLSALVGRRALKWHGDVGESARKGFTRDPADVLAITPESLEALLLSTRWPAQELFSHIRTVVIDEIHAFAAGDRGAHLMALLERICRISNHDIQRIGLSATVGDPEAICDWMSGSSTRPRRIVSPDGMRVQPKLLLDHVGGLANAALLIERLHPGTRRLVFVDSRRRVEELGDQLQQRGVQVYVSHSSLAASERRAAERAFEEGQNCVIVATSALELGIDVGDLDHVLQVDCPSTVSALLQRMGRTGRRPGTTPNCTFLATTEEAVLQAAAMLRLQARGYVEPATPSRRAPHILAHQLLALSLQGPGVSKLEWWNWLDGCAAFSELDAAERESVLERMLSSDILVEVDGYLVLGKHGERLYGRRNFAELYAVFSTPPELKVMHGNQEVGTIDAWFALQTDEAPLRFVLANRAWQVTGIDWRGGTCAVSPAEDAAYPRWTGRPALLSRALCQAMREVLIDDEEDLSWSKRARGVMAELRGRHSFLRELPVPLVTSSDHIRWWNFAGGKGNSLLASWLRNQLGEKVAADNLFVTFRGEAAWSEVAIRDAITVLAAPNALNWEVARRFTPTRARERLTKFQPCLPEKLELDLLVRSLMDMDSAREAAAQAQLLWRS